MKRRPDDPSTRAPALAGGASLGMSPETQRGVVLSEPLDSAVGLARDKCRAKSRHERSESKDDGRGAPGLPGGLHVTGRVRQVVRDLKRYQPIRVILFGSVARGDADRYSDLDFVVIKQTTQPFLARLKEAALLVNVPGSIDLLVYTPEEWDRMQEMDSPFAERVLREGRVVYEARP